jgi:hypothetical protein
MSNCEHRWVQQSEYKPYRGQTRWLYERTVSVCALCGARSASYWRRILSNYIQRDACRNQNRG